MNVDEFNANFQTCTHENLWFSDYLKVEALSNSSMEDFRKSPATYQYYKKYPKKQTESMLFGSLVHCAVLEPDDLAKRYQPKPEDHDGRTKEGKARKAEVEAKGMELVDKLEYDDAMRIAEDLKNIEEEGISTAIAIGKKEFSVFWEKDGIRCKCRPDIYVKEIGMSIDLKTAWKMEDDSFEKAAWYSGYHRKAAWYKEGLEANGLPCNHFLYIAIDSRGYPDFKLFAVPEPVMTVGKLQNEEAFAQFKECTKTNNWPGYPKVIQPLNIPSFIINSLEDKYLK